MGEELVDRVQSVVRSGAPIVVEERQLPPGTDPFAGDLVESSRILPHEVDGHVVGLQVFGRVDGNLFGKAGVLNGDVIVAANGVAISDPDAVPEATRFEARVLVLEVARGGQQRVLVLRW